MLPVSQVVCGGDVAAGEPLSLLSLLLSLSSPCELLVVLVLLLAVVVGCVVEVVVETKL